MKRSRFTECAGPGPKAAQSPHSQIIGILREHEAGMTIAEMCRRHGISQGTFYKYKAKYGGMEVSDAKRLKRLVADLSLDKVALEAVLKKI